MAALATGRRRVDTRLRQQPACAARICGSITPEGNCQTPAGFPLAVEHRLAFSVLMIALGGMLGMSLLLGGFRHFEQSFNMHSPNTFLAVLLPLSVISLILPNYTKSTPDGSFTLPQSVFLILMSLGLYVVFLAIQTVRHRQYFISPEHPTGGHEAAQNAEHEGVAVYSSFYHTAMLFVAMIPIVVLSKKLAKIVDYGIAVAGAPTALGGFLVAVLVLSPEALSAFRAALANQLQRSINICLGSALATIGLTVPAVLLVGMFTGEKVILGLDGTDTIMLLLMLLVSIVNFSSDRTNVLQGAIHLIIFCAYTVLLFD